jgi:drug/metabolite transporter (DMT)-like permease
LWAIVGRFCLIHGLKDGESIGRNMGFFAIGTAISTAVGTIISAEVVRDIGGPMALARWRMLIAALMLVPVTTGVAGWTTLARWQLAPIAASSLFAIVLAEPALNASIARMGSRRTALVFSTNAPLSALFGFVVLGETLKPVQILGGALIVLGIVLAIAFALPTQVARPLKTEVHREARPEAVAIGLGLCAAFGQAIGNLAVRPVMAAHADAFAVMALRAFIAALVLWVVRPFLPRKPHRPAARTFLLTSAGAFISYVLGMSMLMLALGAAPIGIAATLSSMSPIAILPLLWWRTGQPAPWPAWFGALLAGAGTLCLFA